MMVSTAACTRHVSPSCISHSDVSSLVGIGGRVGAVGAGSLLAADAVAAGAVRGRRLLSAWAFAGARGLCFGRQIETTMSFGTTKSASA